MSLQQKTISIGEKAFTIQQLPTTKGLEVTFAIGHILKGMGEGVSEEFVFNFTETKANFGKMVAGMIGCTDVKGTPEFIKNLICDSVIKPDMLGNAELFETEFAGEYELLSEVLEEIIIFNKFHELVKKNLLRIIATVQSDE